MKKFIFLYCLLLAGAAAIAGDKDSSKENSNIEAEKEKLVAIYLKLDSVENSIPYKTGVISLHNGGAQLNVPAGFKFIDATHSQYILEELWKNLPDKSVLGMIVRDSFHVNSLASDWVFVVTYDDMGYVKDDDADKIDYKELLQDMKKVQEEANTERAKLGYETMTLLGWASTPYYDKQNKVLHWAKEIKVSGSDENTLNYEVRVLGRKGVMSLNAIASIDQLQEVKKNIPAILKIAEFEKGSTYADYDSNVDKVAAWTIGGLVAGKILTKVGIFAKFWKLIVIGVGAAIAAMAKFFRKKKGDEYTSNA
jgi:uncharacterized membrane-anchored protein